MMDPYIYVVRNYLELVGFHKKKVQRIENLKDVKLLIKKSSKSQKKAIEWAVRSVGEFEIESKWSLPKAGQTVCVAPGNPKTAALCFDRVWSSDESAPPEIKFFSASTMELGILLAIRHFEDLDDLFGERSEEIAKNLLEPGATVTMKKSDGTESVIPGALFAYGPFVVMNQLIKKNKVEPGDFSYTNYIANSIKKDLGINAIPYGASGAMEDAYSHGRHQVILATINELSLVDEESLNWELVREFRADTESIKKYKRMLHWMDRELVGKSQEYIINEISLKYEDYNYALKKHGIETICGSLSTLLDGRSLLSAAAGGISGQYVAGDLIGVLAGAGILLGKSAISITEKMVSYQDVKKVSGSDIAFLHALPKLSS